MKLPILLVFVVSSACVAQSAATPPSQGGGEPSGGDAPALDAPPPTSGEVRPRMWSLARNVRALNTALDPDAPPQMRVPQQEIIERLLDMQATAEQLSKLPERPTHPLLNAGIDGFMMDIAAALRGAMAAPPDNTLARSVSGACLNCHALRPCPFDSYEQCVDVPIH